MARISRFSQLIIDVLENEYIPLLKTNIELDEDKISILRKHVQNEIKQRVQRNPTHKKLVTRYNLRLLNLSDNILDGVIKLGLYKTDMNEILFVGDIKRQKEELTRIISEYKYGTDANVIKGLSRENTEVKEMNKSQKLKIKELGIELEEKELETPLNNDIKDKKTIADYCNEYIDEYHIDLLNENISEISRNIKSYAQKEGAVFKQASIRIHLQNIKK